MVCDSPGCQIDAAKAASREASIKPLALHTSAMGIAHVGP